MSRNRKTGAVSFGLRSDPYNVLLVTRHKRKEKKIKEENEGRLAI